MDAKADIVIAGGGIGGLIAAELLARAGRRVVVLERSVTPPPFLRPEIIWPAGAQTLFGFKDRADWEIDSMRAMGGMTVHFRGRPNPVLTPDVLRSAGLQPFFTEPNQLRERLIRDSSAEIRRGVEVFDVIRENGRVRGLNARHLNSDSAFSVEADFIIGDDGPESRLRTALRIDLELRRFPVDFLVRGLPWPDGLANDIGQVAITPRDDASGMFAAGFVPVPGGRAAAVAVVRGDVDSHSPTLPIAWRATLDAAGPACAAWRDANFPSEFTRVGRKWGHVARYGENNAVLIGDAAHPVSPAGGQGANMAIADGAAVSHLILAGAPDLAGALESIRRAPNDRGLRPTRLGHRLFLMLENPLLGGLPRLIVPRLLDFPSLIPRIINLLASGSANPSFSD